MEVKKNFVATLSKTQKRKSIGEQAKREKQASTSKNVRQKSRSTVINPIVISWPTLPEDEAIRLTEILREDLKVLKGLKSKPPLKDIREVPKAERSAFRKKFKQEEAEKTGFNTAVHETIRKSLALGVNSVSRELEKNTLSVLVIETKVDPPIMTKLLVPMAEGKNVPVIGLSGIAELLTVAAGFKCIAIGFKEDCKNLLHPLHKIHQNLLEFSKLVKKSEAEETLKSETPVSRYIHPKIRRLQS